MTNYWHTKDVVVLMHVEGINGRLTEQFPEHRDRDPMLALARGHADWILCRGLNLKVKAVGETEAATSSAGLAFRPGEAGLALRPGEATLKRGLDGVSPWLFAFCCPGAVLKVVLIHVFKKFSGAYKPVMTYQLGDVLFSGYSVSAEDGKCFQVGGEKAQHIPTEAEHVTLKYSTLKMVRSGPATCSAAFDLRTGHKL